MEIIVLIVVYAILIICFVWAIVAGIITTHRQKVRDKIAHEIFDNIDLQREKESVVNINPTLNFVVDRNKCPLCGSALTNHRQMVYQASQRNVYGGYLICSTYPKCKFGTRTY